MKFRPVKNGGESGDEDSHAGREHIWNSNSGAERRVECPAGIHSAASHGVDRQDAADHVEIPAKRLILGKARSLAPIMMGIRKFAEVAGIEGTRKKNTMMMPCIGKQAVVGFRREDTFGLEKVDAEQSRHGSADKEHQGDGDQVENAIRLWSVGEEPAFPAVLHIQIVDFARRLSPECIALWLPLLVCIL